MIDCFMIFGASGDLTSRYLLPALAQLHECRELPDEFKIIGVARDDWDTETFQRHIRQRLEHRASHVARISHDAVTSRLAYCKADVTNHDEMASVLAPVKEAVVAYLALPAPVLLPAAQTIIKIGLPAGSRIVVEKPFGEGFASTQQLNQLFHKTFPEQAIFRMDHFLGKQTVQNVLGLRFANRVFEPLWNCQHVQHVEIIWDETLALEERSSYYDSAGALRDMLQNHLLQLLCLVGMEPPPTLGERDFRDHKVGVLRAVRRLSPEEVKCWTVRGRYTAGRIGNRDIPSYVDEKGVDPSRETETFAQITLRIDNWRWAGVPFILRSGKALGKERREIAIHFKSVPHLAFGQHQEPRTNILRLKFNPDRLALGVNINGQGDPFDLEHVEMDTTLTPQEPTAYGRLILDLLRGDPTLSIRDDEAEESWRIVEPILDAWKQGRVPLTEYRAGSDGPNKREGVSTPPPGGADQAA